MGRPCPRTTNALTIVQWVFYIAFHGVKQNHIWIIQSTQPLESIGMGSQWAFIEVDEEDAITYMMWLMIVTLLDIGLAFNGL